MVDATQVTNQLFMLAMAVHESLISVSFMHCFLLCWFFRNRHRVLKPSFFMVLYFSDSNLRICFIDSLLGLDVAWVRFVGRDETCLSDRVIWCCRELFMTTHKSQIEPPWLHGGVHLYRWILQDIWNILTTFIAIIKLCRLYK